MSVLGAQIPLSTYAQTDPEAGGYGLGAGASFVSLLIGLYVISLIAGAMLLPFASRVLGPRTALVVATLLVALGYALWIPLHDSTGQALVNMAIAGVGSGALVAALPAAAAASAPPDRTGFATGMTNTDQDDRWRDRLQHLRDRALRDRQHRRRGQRQRPAQRLPRGLGRLRRVGAARRGQPAGGAEGRLQRHPRRAAPTRRRRPTTRFAWGRARCPRRRCCRSESAIAGRDPGGDRALRDRQHRRRGQRQRPAQRLPRGLGRLRRVAAGSRCGSRARASAAGTPPTSGGMVLVVRIVQHGVEVQLVDLGDRADVAGDRRARPRRAPCPAAGTDAPTLIGLRASPTKSWLPVRTVPWCTRNIAELADERIDGHLEDVRDRRACSGPAPPRRARRRRRSPLRNGGGLPSAGFGISRAKTSSSSCMPAPVSAETKHTGTR